MNNVLQSQNHEVWQAPGSFWVEGLEAVCSHSAQVRLFDTNSAAIRLAQGVGNNQQAAHAATQNNKFKRACWAEARHHSHDKGLQLIAC